MEVLSGQGRGDADIDIPFPPITSTVLRKQANSGNLYAPLADNIIGKCLGKLKKKNHN